MSTHVRLCTCACLCSFLQEMEQLNRIFAVLGTPTEDTWPGVSSMPNAKSASQLARHSGQPKLTPLQPKLGADGKAEPCATL